MKETWVEVQWIDISNIIESQSHDFYQGLIPYEVKNHKFSVGIYKSLMHFFLTKGVYACVKFYVKLTIFF